MDESGNERNRLIPNGAPCRLQDPRLPALSGAVDSLHPTLELADAVQVASAVAINADALVTHDRDFSSVTGLTVIS